MTDTEAAARGYTELHVAPRHARRVWMARRPSSPHASRTSCIGRSRWCATAPTTSSTPNYIAWRGGSAPSNCSTPTTWCATSSRWSPAAIPASYRPPAPIALPNCRRWRSRVRRRAGLGSALEADPGAPGAENRSIRVGHKRSYLRHASCLVAVGRCARRWRRTAWGSRDLCAPRRQDPPLRAEGADTLTGDLALRRVPLERVDG